MTADIPGTVGIGLSLYANRKEIMQTLKRFRRSIQGGTWRVPVFGAGGTGKSTLAKFLTGESDTDVAISQFRESIDSEEYTLPGPVPVVLIVTPGQKRRRATNWPEMYRLLSAGKARAAINVVSWGYHSTALEYEQHRIYEDGLTPTQYVERYIDYSRKDEIDSLKELSPHLESTQGHLSLITLVTKQDLWWNKRTEVHRHYEEGDYGDQIRRIAQVKGVSNFDHEYYYVSLVPVNLNTRDGVQLAVTTAGYDQPLRISNLHGFTKGLSEMIKQG